MTLQEETIAKISQLPEPLVTSATVAVLKVVLMSLGLGKLPQGSQ